MSAIIVFGEGHVSGGGKCQITHGLGIRVCGDKISCPPRQLNGGCIETAPDSNLIGLHLPRTATGVARGCGGCAPHRAALARGGKRAKIVFKNSRENSDCNFICMCLRAITRSSAIAE